MASKESTKAQDRRPIWIWYTASCAISLWFPPSSPGASTPAKTPEILAAKFGIIGREFCSVMLQK